MTILGIFLTDQHWLFKAWAVSAVFGLLVSALCLGLAARSAWELRRNGVARLATNAIVVREALVLLKHGVHLFFVWLIITRFHELVFKLEPPHLAVEFTIAIFAIPWLATAYSVHDLFTRFAIERYIEEHPEFGRKS